MKEFMNVILFYIFRFSAVILALYLAYIVVYKVLGPNVAEKMCLSKTKNCSQLNIYRNQNTFIAQESISQIWMWYNGQKLFVYGQAGGNCESQGGMSFVPVTVFQLSSGDEINFTQFPNECIPNYDNIIKSYVIEGSKEETIFLYRKDPNELNTIFNVVKNMVDNKIFVV
jgi:hypothetical protein